MTGLEKLADIMMFRQKPEDDENNRPVITTGSVIWGLLLRSSIIIIFSMIIIQYTGKYDYWWIVLILLWFLAAYPAYTQYHNFTEKMKTFEDSTLCGSCRYFDPTSQRCKILDQHVTADFIPCEGNSWEPKGFDDY